MRFLTEPALSERQSKDPYLYSINEENLRGKGLAEDYTARNGKVL